MERREKLGLCYLVERDSRGVFGVFIKPSEDVAALRAAIKEASFGYDDIDADELELYLAQQPSGDWLSSDSDEVKAIEEGDEDMIDKLCVTPLNLTEKLSQHFDAASLGRRKVHVLVKICYQMTVEERIRRSHEVRDGEVRLWCIVVGEGTTIFPVIIKKTARVEDLQVLLKVRVYRLALDVREETINIYEAVDPHGNSLKDSSPDVAALRAGNEAVADKWLRKKLDPLKTIAEIFHNFEEHTVHFLALPPSTFTVREFKRSWTLAEPYEEAAKSLNIAQEVSELVTIVKDLGTLSSATQQTIPFILLTSSSGTGKTQMAFNLMARDEFDVFWVGCVNGMNPIRGALCHRSSAFTDCVDKDIREVGAAGVSDISQQSELYTYAFIRTMLRNLPGFTGPRTRAEVLDAIKDRRARGSHCVFFLDDYPHIDNSMSEEEKTLWTRKMRFMRNVFRSFGLAVIVSASNKAAKSILTTAIKTETDDELWCVVYPLLPRFEDPSLKSLPRELQTIITSSRPLFAKMAMEYVSSHPYDEGMDVAKYLDAMVQSLARRFVYGGRYIPEKFNESQIRLFLASSYKKSSGEYDDTNAPIGDFSRLYETEVFQLWLRDGKYPVKGENGTEPWRWCSISPSPAEDILLHLCLGAVHVLKNQRVSPISLREAFAFETIGNTTMAELVTGALVVASRRGGLDGLPFPRFLSVLLYELEVLRERDTELRLPGKVTELMALAEKIPFLPPPTVEWPEFLATALNIGSLKQSGSSDANSISLQFGAISVQGNLSQRALTKDDLVACFDRVPAECTVVLFFVQDMKDLLSYFKKRKQKRDRKNKKRKFDDVTRECPWLLRAVFYGVNRVEDGMLRVETESVSVRHMRNNCNNAECTGKRACEHIDKMVILVELPESRAYTVFAKVKVPACHANNLGAAEQNISTCSTYLQCIHAAPQYPGEQDTSVNHLQDLVDF